MRDKPLIRLHKTVNGYYFYDVHYNQIVKVSEREYNALERIMNGQTNLQEEEQLLNKYIHKRYLSCEKTSIMEHEKTQDVEHILDGNVTSITLQMTQQCNLRCAYCVYSGEFLAQRKHSQQRMPLDIAYQAIDFLMQHSRYEEAVDIAFYGGEPMLEFANMKKVIEYIENVYPEKRVTYHMTTNGTLLSPDVMDFLVSKNFSIMVSIDGPEKIHDMHRRFASNGKGSFSIIRKNLKEIQKRYPDFYSNMLLSMVQDPKNDYSEIKAIMNDEVFRDLYILSSVVDDTFSLKKAIYKDQYVKRRKYDLFLGYLMVIKNEDVKGLLNNVLEEIMSRLQKRNLFTEGRFNNDFSPRGACVAGQNKLFVDVNGNFYPCEKVSEKASIMKIGNIIQGFDYEKIKALMNIGKIDENMCKNCWAIRECDICAAYCERNGKLSSIMRNMNCIGVRDDCDEKHQIVILLQEAETVYGYNVKRV